MKKIWKFIVPVVALLIFVCVNASAQGVSSINTAFEYLDVLKKLEIVNDDYDSNSLDETQKVTRADFAVYFAKMMNYDVSVQSTLYYNDVPKSHYAYNEITYLTDRNIFSGVGEKSFKPDDIMKKEHAYVVLLRALGYSYDMINGNAISTAQRADITSDVSGSEDLLLCDLFVMMYNTLMAETMMLDEYNGYSATYKEGNTLLYETRDMVFERGKFLSAAEGASLLGEDVYTNDVVIEGNKYVTDIKNVISYLGYKVNFIYIEGDNENEIIWIEANNKTDFVSLDIDEDSSFSASDWSIEYGKGAKGKTYKMAQNIAMVYNGRFVKDSLSDIFNKSKYHITLIAHNSNNYNYAIVEAYENVMVEYKNETDENVYDSISETTINMSQEDYDSFKILDINGDEIKFSDIKENSIISIFRSLDNECFKAIVSNKVVSGNVSGISDDGIVIDGVCYDFYDANNTFTASIKSVTFYLDHKGYIAYADKRFLGNNQYVAYVYKVTLDDYEEALYFKILNENGNLEQYTSTSDLKIDGIRYTDMKTALEQFTKTTTGTFKPQIMLINVNKDGLINFVHRASDEGGTSKLLVKNKELPNVPGKPWYAYSRASQGIIGINALYDDNTKVFKVPADEKITDAPDTQFSVVKPGDRQNFSGAVTYKVTDEDVFYEQYIVLKQASDVEIARAAQFFVVNEINDKLNSDDEVVSYVSGMLGGTEVEYELDFDYGMTDEILSSNSGDIYIIGLNDNKIASYKRVYNYLPGNTTLDFYSNTNEAKDYGEAESRYFIGYVKDRKGTALKIDYENDGVIDQVANLKSGSNNIMVYDSKSKGKLYKGSIDDITHHSLIVVNTTYNSNISIVVYK